MSIDVHVAAQQFLGELQPHPGEEPGNVVWTRAQRYFPSLAKWHQHSIMHDLSDVYEAAYALPAHQHDAIYAAAQLAHLQRRFMNHLRSYDAIRPTTYAYFHILATWHYTRLCDKLRRIRPAFRQGSRIRRRAHVHGAVEHPWVQ